MPSHSIELHQSFEHLSVELHQPYDAPHGDQYPPSIRGETVRISTEENGLSPHFSEYLILMYIHLRMTWLAVGLIIYAFCRV